MNRTIPSTPALTGHPSARRRSLRHAALVALCAALVALVAVACTADTLDGRQPDAATDPDVLTFAVSARPAFTEVPVSGQDTAAPSTRAVQTPGATRWEQGDILWLTAYFYRDRQNTAPPDTICASALKYDGAEWRYLTVAEAEDLNTANIPNFVRLLRWPRGSADWADPGIEIRAYYAGSGTPDSDGIITVTPDGTLPVTPELGAMSKLSAPGEEPVSLRFHPNSRIRIPAGYTVKFDNFNYTAVVRPSDGGISIQTTWDSSIPAPQEDTYVFLSLNNTSTATLTRDGVSCTFTFAPLPGVADPVFAYNGASYTLTPYTSGAETPGGYDLIVATETDLRTFADSVNAGGTINGKPAAEARVLQTADIHLTQGEWVPIGKGYDTRFRGAYNGNGNEISGLTITTAPQPDADNYSYVGLFGRTEGAVLTGIRLREVGINFSQGSGDYLYVGSIAGWLENSTLSLCTADGTVNTDGGNEDVVAGGIAGISAYSTISRCRADVETKAATTNANGIAFAGGIAGWNSVYSFILSCESGDRAVTAEESGRAKAGGIAGHSSDHTYIAFCRTGKNNVTARNATWESYAGGLIGYNQGFLFSCYSRATAEATGLRIICAGAIVGEGIFGNEQYCYGAGAKGQGSSNVDANPGLSIVYNANPGPGKIFGVITSYPGKVEFIDFKGTLYYPFTTTYDPSATPAYGIIPQRAVWTKDAWKDGSALLYPEININYEGKIDN